MEFRFDNDRLCVDFMATECGPSHVPMDAFRHSSDLTGWIERAGVVDDARGLDTLELVRAKQVRQLLADVVRQAKHDVGQLARLDHDRLNRLNELSRGRRPQLTLAGGRVVRSGGFEAFLTEVVTDAIDLLSAPDLLERIGWCAVPLCRRVFLDRSTGRRRQCCSVRCRDKRNADRHRQRQLRGRGAS